jgi:hypothetical protein
VKVASTVRWGVVGKAGHAARWLPTLSDQFISKQDSPFLRDRVRFLS